MSQFTLNPEIYNLVFKDTKFINRGSLISFNYMFWKHDVYPLVIVTDYNPGFLIRGINLHYMTFPYIRRLLFSFGDNPNFSYFNIKTEPYIVRAFRSYKWKGIRNIKIFDSKYISSIVKIAQGFDPLKIRALREAVEQQIKERVQENILNLSSNQIITPNQ